MRGQGEAIIAADRGGFGAVWLRDVPLQTAPGADVGQVYDPWTYAAWLAATTEHVTIGLGSAIITLRHPIDIAKQTCSIDQLSGGRLVLGVASGDRPVEFPAYGLDHANRAARFRDSLAMLRGLIETGRADSPLGSTGTARLLPPPVGRIPLVITGSAGQELDWISRHADGWLVYPGPTATADGPKALARSWPGGGTST